jgi:o-succinylbenzoate synthase
VTSRPQGGEARPEGGGEAAQHRLAGVELVRLRLPLRSPWVTSAGRVSHRDVILVRTPVGDVDGWGECVAQGEPTYTAEYVEGAWDVLTRHLVPRLLDGTPARWDGQAGPSAGVLAAVKGHPMAKAALETALLDAHLSASGRSLADHLAACSAAQDPPAASVVAGVAVGIADDPDALADEVGGYVAAGYLRVKLKVHPGWDTVPIAVVRERWAPDELMVQVDANGTYAALADPATALARLDGAGLLLVEQPLGDEDLVGHARLAARIATPVCLDESISSDAVAETAIALGSCRVVNIKPGRVGGLLEAVRIHDRCLAAGIPVWCGGMLETGVGRAANLALASLPGFTLPGDISASDRFWEQDLVTDPAQLRDDGTIAVPSGPGIGVKVRDDLDGVVVDRRWLARR